MVVPTPVHQLHKAHAALDHPSGQQTVGGEGIDRFFVHAVRFENNFSRVPQAPHAARS